jgi:DNA repair protein RadC
MEKLDTLYELELETFKIKLAVAEPTLTPARCSQDVAAIMRPIYASLDADQEHFAVLLLNQKNRVRAFKIISSGSLTASLVHPREVFRAVALYGAAAVVLCHNHPAGDPAPSAEDVDITRRLVECGEIMGVRMVDHVILGKDSIFSFDDRGMMHGSPAPVKRPEPALRSDGKKRRSDFGKARLRDYKPRKDKGIPRGPRKRRDEAPAPTTARARKAHDLDFQ